MAILNGIEIKRVTKRTGHKYPIIYSAVVRMDGKKIGDWSQDGWGGPDDYSDGLYKIIKDKAETFCKGVSDSLYSKIADEPDIFMGNLVMLLSMEDAMKKLAKKGCQTIILLPMQNQYTVHGYKDLVNDAKITKDLGRKEGYANRIVIRGNDICLDITVDESHPAPAWMTEM